MSHSGTWHKSEGRACRRFKRRELINILEGGSKNMKRIWELYAIVVLLSPGVVHADLSNGGFETGDFTGWTVALAPGVPNTDSGITGPLGPEGAVNAVTSFGTLTPAEGSYFAEIISPLYYTTSTSIQVITSVSQDIYLMQGDHLSGCSAFDNNDIGGVDTSWVKLYSGGVEIANPWYAYSGGFAQPPAYASGYGYVAAHETTPWISWDWTAPATGVYTLELATQSIVPTGDSCESSAFFDNINIAVEVPEPPGLLLAGCAMIGLVGVSRRFNQWRMREGHQVALSTARAPVRTPARFE